MTEQSIPESRAYRHTKCGNETVVGGQPFELVSNPMSSMEQTQCSTCSAMFPISDFEWVDTGENISAYYARHSMSATDTQRFLCSKKFMIGMILLFAIIAAGAVSVFVANNNVFPRILGLFGGLVVGAIIGMVVFLNGFANPIMRKVCGVSDTRMLS